MLHVAVVLGQHQVAAFLLWHVCYCKNLSSVRSVLTLTQLTVIEMFGGFCGNLLKLLSVAFTDTLASAAFMGCKIGL